VLTVYILLKYQKSCSALYTTLHFITCGHVSFVTYKVATSFAF